MDTHPRRRWKLPSRGTVALVGAVCVVLFLVVAALEVPAPQPPTFPTPAASVALGPQVGELNSTFFGINVQEVGIGSSVLSARVNSTPLTVFRFSPAGEATDQIAGLTYTANGIAEPAIGFTDAQFVNWCLERACHAIMMVPAEVDNVSLAVATVRYVETVLGFHPDYWSIGNEPQQWQHWGVPWSQWQTTDHSTPTPFEYALEVESYARALHAFDPKIRLIGIESVAGGASMLPWFQQVVAHAGPWLAAVSYHAYPAGVGRGTATLDQFYGYLGRPGEFPLNYPSTVRAVQQACATCHLQVFVDEFNSALGAAFAPYLESYPNAVFVGATLVQSILEGIPRVAYFDLADLNPDLPYSMLYTGGGARPTYLLYSTIFENLTVGAVRGANVSVALPGVYALETENGTRSSLLIINSNLQSGFDLAWAGVGGRATRATVWDWSPSVGAPVVSSGSGSGAPTHAIVAPQGILLVDLSS